MIDLRGLVRMLRLLAVKETRMYFKQLVKEDSGCASYIVGCTGASVCAVVDPRLDMVDDILALAEAKGMQVAAVIETHNHADHVSWPAILSSSVM
jgi:glyoxylase-like metal-dependent hydrolase (beta-lactamase superfamily II)